MAYTDWKQPRLKGTSGDGLAKMLSTVPATLPVALVPTKSAAWTTTDGTFNDQPFEWHLDGIMDPMGLVSVSTNTSGSFTRLHIMGGPGLYEIKGSIILDSSKPGAEAGDARGGSVSEFHVDLHEGGSRVRYLTDLASGQNEVTLHFDEHRVVSTATEYLEVVLDFKDWEMGGCSAENTVNVDTYGSGDGGYLIITRKAVSGFGGVL